MSIVHVYPSNDLIEHDTEGDECACGVTSEPVMRDDGSCGWLITHHSLDGREARETNPTPEGAAMSNPSEIKPGQMWRDNDPKSRSGGEFTVVDVVTPDSDAQDVADKLGDIGSRRLAYARWRNRTYALVRRHDSDHRTWIDIDRLVNHGNRRTGYTYLGMSR